jgi:nucleoside-diphosphate-sugar epimerase
MITVLGAGGFIGGHLVAELERRDIPHWAPGRDEPLRGRELGDVVYCAGLTEDFRRRPLDTVVAHAGDLEALLRTAEMCSLVYLSSTRIYRSPDAATEDGALHLDPSDPDHLYDISKALGEALSLASGVPALVLRLANTYGLDLGSSNFLAGILRDAVCDGEVTLCTSLDSTKNYVSVDDVVTAIIALLQREARNTYNVAGDRAVSHRDVADRLRELTGCEIHVADGAPTETAPDISIDRLRATIDYSPESVLDALPRLVAGYRHAVAGTLGV